MLWVFVVLFLGLGVLFYFMVRGFIHPVDRHSVPANLPFTVEEVQIPLPDSRHLYGWWVCPHGNFCAWLGPERRAHGTLPEKILLSGNEHARF